MKLNRLTLSLAVAITLLAMGTGKVFAQGDDTRALIDTMVKKGLLTNQEAADVAAKMHKDVQMNNGYKLKLASWLDELKIYGDARVRYEEFWDRKVTGTLTGVNDEQDRTRFRLRLRLGLEAKAGEWTAGLRLASGDSSGNTADAISTNTTFTNWGTKKNINIDMAYLMFDPKCIDGLKLTAGKFENPFWETDMMYDGDFTPEGFAEQYKRSFFHDNYTVFGNFSQWVLFENNATSGSPSGPADNSIRGKDTYMLGFQAGHDWKIIPKKLSLKQAVSFYDYEGLQDTSWVAGTSFGTGDVFRNSSAALFGNTVLEDHFNILTVNNEVRLDFWEKYPIRLQGEFIHNFGENNVTANQDAYLNEGYKVGGILGEAKKKGDWQIGYWYEFLGANANISWLSDSDFGNGGTNNKGSIVKATYNITDWASIGFAYWNVTAIKDVVNSGALGTQVNQNAGNVSRLQCDVVMKF